MKPPLLLLHGALGSNQQFDSVVKELEASFEVHTMNFDGHGGHASSNDFSMHFFAENVIDYLQEHSIEATHIFGYSMGGYVALQLALMAPEKVKCIITLGTKFAWEAASAEKEVQMLHPEIIEMKVPRFAESLKQTHAPQDWKEVMHKTAQMMRAMGAGARLTDDDYKNIPHEVMLGIGSLDRMVSYEESAHVAALLPNATLIQLEGIPHPIEKVASEDLVQYIKSNIKGS